MIYVEGSWLANESEWFPEAKKEAAGNVSAGVGVLAVVAETLYSRTANTREFLKQLAWSKARQLYRRGLCRRF